MQSKNCYNYRIYLLAANYWATTIEEKVASIEIKTEQKLSSIWRRRIWNQIFDAGFHPVKWTGRTGPNATDTSVLCSCRQNLKKVSAICTQQHRGKIDIASIMVISKVYLG